MNLETLLIYFERFDYEDDCAYYARKDDGLMLVVKDEYEQPHLLAFLNVYDDGSVIGCTYDPDLDAVINVNCDHTDNIPVDVFRPIE